MTDVSIPSWSGPSWSGMVWTEAGQIRALLGWPPSPEDDALSPEAFFARLCGEGRLAEAVRFLGQALPRFEAVRWAIREVAHLRPAMAEGPGAAFDAAEAWLRDPGDARRRAARAAAIRLTRPSPGGLCALAVFASGGSVAPEDKPPVPAPKAAAGKFAAGAILLAAAEHGPAQPRLRAALQHGETVVRGRTET
jgi:hypothetical protein